MNLWCCSEEVIGQTQTSTFIRDNSLIIFSPKMACKIQKNLYQADEWLCFKGFVSYFRKRNLYSVDTSVNWTTAKIPYVSAWYRLHFQICFGQINQASRIFCLFSLDTTEAGAEEARGRNDKGIIVFFRRSDCGNDARRCEQEKQRGALVGGESVITSSFVFPAL